MDRDSKSAIAWEARIVAGIKPQFSLADVENINVDHIEKVYSVSLQLSQLERHIDVNALKRVFDVYRPTNPQGEMETPSALLQNAGVKIGNLLGDYRKFTLYEIKQSVKLVSQYAPEYMLWGMSLTMTLLENCCDHDLRHQVYGQLQGLPSSEVGGPVYMKLVVDAVTATSFVVSEALAYRIQRIRIKDYPGEDVAKVVGHLRAVIIRLEQSNQLPTTMPLRILWILQTSSNKKFNQVFSVWEASLSQKDTRKGEALEDLIDVEDVFAAALRHYHAAVEANTWQRTTSRPGSTFAISSGGRDESTANTSDTGTANLPRSNARSSSSSTEGEAPWKRAPGPGEPDERMWKGRPEYYCRKCRRWRRHRTEEHHGGRSSGSSSGSSSTQGSGNVSSVLTRTQG